MRSFLFALTIIFLFSCNTKKENEINLFNNYVFRLLPNEQLLKITDTTKKEYLKYIQNKSIQIPLFRHIKSNLYELYLGLPVNVALSEILKSNLSYSVRKTDNLRYDFKEYKTLDNYYVVEYVVKIKPYNNMLYVLGVTKSKEISDSLFNFKTLSNRIEIVK
jgi:predicted nucleotidyltransferase